MGQAQDPAVVPPARTAGPADQARWAAAAFPDFASFSDAPPAPRLYDTDELYAEITLLSRDLQAAGLSPQDVQELLPLPDLGLLEGAVRALDAGLDRDQVMGAARDGGNLSSAAVFVLFGLSPAHAAAACTQVTPARFQEKLVAAGALPRDVTGALDAGGRLMGLERVLPVLGTDDGPQVRLLAALLAGVNGAVGSSGPRESRASLCVIAARAAAGEPWASTLVAFAADGMPLGAAVVAARAVEQDVPVLEVERETRVSRPASPPETQQRSRA
jgi:hypothetical protein